MQQMQLVLLLLLPPKKALFICLYNEGAFPLTGTLRKNVCMGGSPLCSYPDVFRTFQMASAELDA